MKRPNILLITSDQQHHDTIGKFNSKIQTPYLDKLCDEGMNWRTFIQKWLLYWFNW